MRQERTSRCGNLPSSPAVSSGETENPRLGKRCGLLPGRPVLRPRPLAGGQAGAGHSPAQQGLLRRSPQGRSRPGRMAVALRRARMDFGKRSGRHRRFPRQSRAPLPAPRHPHERPAAGGAHRASLEMFPHGPPGSSRLRRFPPGRAADREGRDFHPGGAMRF
jgi:hypothetical protein